MLEDEGIEDVRVGMQLGLQRAKRRIDRRLHDAGGLDRIPEQMPDAAVSADLESRDPRLPRLPREAPAVGELTAAAWMKRAPLEHDGARPRVQHARLEREDVGMVVTEVA